MRYHHVLSRPKAIAAAAALVAAAGISAPVISARADAAAVPARATCSLTPAPPAGFIERKVRVDGIGINYVRGGHGPTLLLLHGYPETWYSWDAVLPTLARHFTVVAPDLPGAGLSDAPAAAGNYTKKAMAADIYALMVKLGLSHNIRIVGHDIGTMVAYSYAAAHPRDVTKLVLSEAPIPDQTLYQFPALTAHGPGLWWFGLFDLSDGLPERLVSDNVKVWMTDFFPNLEAVQGAVTACDIAVFTRAMERPGHVRASIDWFATFALDVKNDAVYQKTKLTMPVLAIGASNSLGSFMGTQAREYATDVTGAVIPDSGHWIYAEHTAELTRLLLTFLR